MECERNKRPYFGFEEGYSLLEDFPFFPSSEPRICDLGFEAFGIDGEKLDADGSSSEKRVYRGVSHFGSGKCESWRFPVPIR